MTKPPKPAPDRQTISEISAIILAIATDRINPQGDRKAARARLAQQRKTLAMLKRTLRGMG